MYNLLPRILLAYLIFWGENVENSNHKCFLELIPIIEFFSKDFNHGPDRQLLVTTLKD